jgi:translation elongation factor EF-1beta
MPNGYKHRQYGEHEYPNPEGTSDCIYGCGCWMGPSRSDGPLGVDPHGLCPNHPLDDGPLRKGIDYEDLVNQRIRALKIEVKRQEERAEKAEVAAGIERMELVDQLANTERKVKNLEKKLDEIQGIIERPMV